GIALLLVTVLLAWLVSRALRQRLAKLAAATHRLAAGDYATRIERTSDDELDALVNDFNRMAQALDDTERNRRAFIADISHELRTPLAVIRGATELLLTRPGLDEKVLQRLQRIQRAEQQCSDLIGALLLLSRNERGQGTSNVARVAEQLLDAHRAQLGGKP
ncbi:histidine kinase dimerization/phospho-acceptor domain-containing protein, partial [Mesorhizobium sp. M8A.F.Ca.ET.207.01.1.1]|uniref:histidine kinase dimerization/phospho-acceptor domain-containing protein n=1 Tax=Mesorhizobium sp. M8A.F.Ca.ET.207.01.1.1 TaxID=2563968 RepID=UPI0016747375